jgi:hypothetical protein
MPRHYVQAEAGEGGAVKKKATNHHVRIDDFIYKSAAFITLPGSAVKLYVDLRTQLHAYNNGNIDATMSTLSKRGWNSVSKVQRASSEILAARRT